MINRIKQYLRIFLGSWSSRNTYAKDKAWFKENERLGHLGKLDFGNEDENDESSPIFIFSAGWRSGSTLLQRLILSSEDILMWGEPYDKANIIESMSQSIIPFSTAWPPDDRYLGNDNTKNLSQKWVASLYPSKKALKKAHRSFFNTLFDYSVDGKEIRWGVKEVRWGKREALYLKWLYPKAKFIFLVRNPYQSYNSFKAFEDSWYAAWPTERIYNPYSFAKHWNRLVSEFFDVYDNVSGIFIQYEDLIAKDQSMIEKINQYLGMQIDASILEKKVGSTAKLGRKLSRTERLIINHITKNNYRKLY